MVKNKAWIYCTNIYEVNLRQYTLEGSFKAFQAHLPRLKEMGVKTLWFMPITPISEKEKKGTMGSYYACSDYVSINPEFGTMADFKELVSTMKEALSDVRRLRKMGKESYRIVKEEINIQKMVETFVTALNSLK